MPLSAKENLWCAIRPVKPAYVPYSAEGVLRLVDHRGRKPPRAGTDEWGVTWAPLPESYVAGAGEPAESYATGHPAKSCAELLTRTFPDPSDPSLFAGLLIGINTDRALVIGQHPAGPLDRLCALLDMPTAMLALMSEPEAAFAVLERIADYHVGIARGYLAAGVEAGFLADDYAGRDGPFLRPKLWQKLILPGLRRIIAVYRDAGAPLFFHTCGRAEAFIPDLVDAGVTVFNLQSSACDLPALKARFGRRIAFYGGVANELMMTGTPEEVRAAARAAIETLSQEGGLILAPDQPLAFPPENEAALVETAQRYGRYPLG
ncbi:MAG: hypothetical protein AUK03_05465 [Anaerolineae bacterium CG2_30_64_16]|nr:MAG: hypothetical protein AUK03_05465 [Anaerolineae bacterium CG2_30_64_16]